MDDVERNLDDPKAFPASDFAHSAPETGENGSAATDPSATPSTTPSALDADDVFNPDTHVLLGQELKTDRQVKVVLRALYWTAALSAGALAAVFALKARLSGRPLIDTRRLHQLNVAFAALHLGASAATAVVLALRLRLVARAGLAWSKRRRRWVNLYSSQLALVMLLAAAFLAPNAHMLTNPCGHVDAPVWVAHGVRFTCWNSLLALFVIGVRNYTPSTEAADRPDAILLDAPWRVHWPVGVYWMAFEVGLAVAVAGRLATSSAETACREIESGQCDPGGVWLFSAILFGVLFIGYVAMYARSARRAFVELGNKAYCEFRWTNVDLRYQVRIGTLVMLFGLADILLWFAEMRSCLSFVMARFGLLPAEFSVTAFTIVDCAFMLPGRPGTRPPEDAAHGLENYRWGEEEAGRPGCCDGNRPLFCFETAAKVHHWCEMIYAYNARTGLVADPFDIKSALALYDLDSIEFVHSRRTDSLAVVAWSPALVLVSFRGTSSITNILADLRAWLVVHPPPRRAHCRLRGRPRVHKGFLDSWTAGGFNQQVLKLISDVLSLPGYDRSTMRVLVTGHSLGGAIAQLAAFEISSTLKVGPCRVSCYTLGCPKVGNRAFACEYHRAVPDTWHVVNDLDVVARTPELLWYKRAGRRVVMNAKGDMIVEPVYVEFKFLSLMPAKVSVAHHLLAGYKRSVSAVASAQLVHGRGIPGHRLAVQKLLKKAHITKLLGLTEAGSCDLNSLIWPGRFRRSRGQLSTQRLASETLTDPTSTVDELEGVGMGDCMSLLHALYKAVKCWIAGLRGIDCDLDCDEEQSFEMGDRLGGGGGNGPTEKAIIMPGVGVCLYKG